MTTGSRIKKARELAQLSREELAQALGVSSKSIANWETDRTTPQNKMAVLEAVLGVDLSDPAHPRFDPIAAYRTSIELTDYAMEQGVNPVVVLRGVSAISEMAAQLFALPEKAQGPDEEITESQQSQGSPQSSRSSRSGAPIGADLDTLEAREGALNESAASLLNALEEGRSTQKKRTGER